MASYSAFDTSLYLLGFKDRTKKELEDKLRDKGYSEEEIESAVNKVMEYGYINDSEYARRYIKSRLNKKGAKLIMRELQNKGISRDTISCHLEELAIDSSELIYEILIKKYYNADVSDRGVKQKIMSYFVRRGYDYEDINAALHKFVNKLYENAAL